MKANQEQRKVRRTFLGEGNSETYRKGQIITLEAQRAAQYDARGLTEEVKARPTKAAIAASEAKKAAGASENKSTGPGFTKGK